VTPETLNTGNAVNAINAVSEIPAKWELTIVALPGKPGEPEAGYRLKSLLKRLLRTHGFRCTGIKGGKS
jgi:hypothetical protein